MSGTHAHTARDRHRQATDPEKADTDDVKRASERPARGRTVLITLVLLAVALAGAWWLATL